MQTTKSDEFRVSIDVGGTFTDVTLMREATGEMWSSKVLTTYSKGIAVGVVSALQRILRSSRANPGNIVSIMHATTIATNTILQKNGAKTGVLATEGHRDVLEIGRMKRPDAYDISIDTWTPVFIAPKRFRIGVPERVDTSGNIVKELDRESVVKAVDELVKEGVQSIAICYLFSFLNPKNERVTKEIIASRYPSLYVTASSDLHPEFREYERTCLTAVNAYIGPIVGTYLENLEKEFEKLGANAGLYVMQSNGGIANVTTAKRVAVRMIESGPAAGVIASGFIGGTSGFPNLISFDMGGTTAKAGLILDGKPHMVTQYELYSFKGRFVAGAFFPIKVPAVDLAEVGTGGGSVAWQDVGGNLRVGPRSAGSNPGPVCYGLGGEEPTVTDANVVLGYINPESIAGGEIKLDYSAAKAAISERLAKPLGMDLIEVASGITKIANIQMAQAVRLVSIGRGFDPRDYPLMALGGSGPLHALRLAEELEIDTVIVPDNPGVATTFGLLSVDFAADTSATHVQPLAEATRETVSDRFTKLAESLTSQMEREGIPVKGLIIDRTLDMRYVSQGYEINVPIGQRELKGDTIHNLSKAFNDAHKRLYGYALEDNPIELVTYRVSGFVPITKPKLRKYPTTGSSSDAAIKTTRKAYFESNAEFTKVPVYDSGLLKTGNRIGGPAIVEYLNATLVIQPEYDARVDEWRNLVMKVRKQK